MTTDMAEKLAMYGIDYVDAMDRFGENTALYKRLALKYLSDTHYVDLLAAMEVKDFDQAYHAAHSLKGVAGNLSLETLYETAKLVSDALYVGEYQAAQMHMPELKEAHEKVLAGLEKWQNDEL